MTTAEFKALMVHNLWKGASTVERPCPFCTSSYAESIADRQRDCCQCSEFWRQSGLIPADLIMDPDDDRSWRAGQMLPPLEGA